MALGSLFIRLGRLQEGLEHFRQASRFAEQDTDVIRYRMHEAIVLGLLSQPDRSLRILTSLSTTANDDTPTRLNMQLHSNLAVAQGLNEFYREAKANTITALQLAISQRDTSNQAILYNNLGHFQVELGEYGDAEANLKSAISLIESPPLQTITELSRVYLLQQRFEESASYAEQAVKMVWSSVLNFEREEIARLCSLLAHLSYYSGELPMAMRLVEKSQLLFGQLSMWSQWKQTQSLMDQWSNATTPARGNTKVPQVDLDATREFLFLFDAMNAQELTFREFSNLTDARVETVQALCHALGVTGERFDNLVYAARFADYGLTAVEPEVVKQPTRSESAWAQYVTHPDLSIRMLQVATVPAQVITMIRDHHEHWDGSGFPSGKQSRDLSPDTQLLNVADRYATQLVLEHQPHSRALHHIQQISGTVLSPSVVQTFSSLFE